MEVLFWILLVVNIVAAIFNVAIILVHFLAKANNYNIFRRHLVILSFIQLLMALSAIPSNPTIISKNKTIILVHPKTFDLPSVYPYSGIYVLFALSLLLQLFNCIMFRSSILHPNSLGKWMKGKIIFTLMGVGTIINVAIVTVSWILHSDTENSDIDVFSTIEFSLDETQSAEVLTSCAIIWFMLIIAFWYINAHIAWKDVIASNNTRPNFKRDNKRILIVLLIQCTSTALLLILPIMTSRILYHAGQGNVAWITFSWNLIPLLNAVFTFLFPDFHEFVKSAIGRSTTLVTGVAS